MPIDSNALTLTDYALMANDPLTERITSSLIFNGSFLTDCPISTKATIYQNFSRMENGNLPSVTWRKLNEAATATKGTPTPWQEQVYLMSNAIEVDHVLLKDQNQIVDPRGQQLDWYLQAVTYDLNDKFINNNQISGDDDAFVGIRTRLDNPTTYKVASEMKIDAGGVELSQANITAANANKFLEFLTQMLSYMANDDGMGVVFYYNDTLQRRMEFAIRLLGAAAGFNTQEDAFGRQVQHFRNAKLVNIGRKADGSTRVITSTETSAGADGASNYTSMYAVNYGVERFAAWQMSELVLGDAIKHMGEYYSGGNVDRTVIDWQFGLYQQHNRAIGRIYGIKVS